MSRISNTATSISRPFKTFFRAIRQRFWALAVTIVGICAPAYIMAWYFDVFDNIPSSITVSILVTAMAVLQLISPPERLTFKSFPVWISVIAVITLTLSIGDEYNWRFVTFSVILVVLALPSCWILWELVRQEWVLLTGFALALLAAMIYWTAALVVNDLTFDIIFLPLPYISLPGILWAPVASWTLKSARKLKYRRVSGPGMQALAMTTLFVPIFLVVLTLPTGLGLSPMWSNVSLALIGIFFSGVISEPLRRMLIEWGKLAPHKNASALPNPYAD